MGEWSRDLNLRRCAELVSERLRKDAKPPNWDKILSRPKFEPWIQKYENATKITGPLGSTNFSLNSTIITRCVLLLLCDGVVRVHLHVKEGNPNLLHRWFSVILFLRFGMPRDIGTVVSFSYN
jgi:hypothetical protein